MAIVAITETRSVMVFMVNRAFIRVCSSPNANASSPVCLGDVVSRIGKSPAAGGLAEFDNSASDATRGLLLPADSPQPGPLPWGEGEPSSARSTIHTCRISTAQCSLLPLPEGEGQGEGKVTAALRHANFFALRCDNCPEVHMASSHSSFQVSGFAGGR